MGDTVQKTGWEMGAIHESCPNLYYCGWQNYVIFCTSVFPETNLIKATCRIPFEYVVTNVK